MSDTDAMGRSREDCCVKSRRVLKDSKRDQGHTQPEMFAPTPSTLSVKTMLAARLHDRNKHRKRDYIALAIDVHSAFLCKTIRRIKIVKR